MMNVAARNTGKCAGFIAQNASPEYTGSSKQSKTVSYLAFLRTLRRLLWQRIRLAVQVLKNRIWERDILRQ